MENKLIRDYQIVSEIESWSGYGNMVVVHNNSTHYLVIERVHSGDGTPLDWGNIRASFGYFGNGASAARAYCEALQYAVTESVRRCKDEAEMDENVNDWPDACPGCGCTPGNGITESCEDANGCAYWRAETGGRKPVCK